MKKALKIIGVIIIALAIVFVAYLETGHYNADSIATSFTSTSENDDYITYDKGSNVGFIFYPGGKVESSAYSYLSAVDANVYIAKFPFELAMFDYTVAEQIIEDNPTITDWYIGGHSLGGVFANRFAVANPGVFNGVVFLGSYAAEGDLSDIPGLALFGDQDLVVGDYTEKLDSLSDSTEVVVLENANHSGFGNYGQQKGDSELTADAKATQQKTIIKDINAFINENK